MSNALKRLGASMRAARERAHMSQSDVGRALDVKKQTVSQWETGRSPPSMLHLMAFSELVHVPIAELFTDDRGPITLDASSESASGSRSAQIASNLVFKRIATTSPVVPIYPMHLVGEILMGFVDPGSPRLSKRKYVPTHTQYPDGAMAFAIEGPSMLPRFRPGDIVVVVPVENVKTEVKPGQYVLACASGDFVFRRYRPVRLDTHVGARLVASNKIWPDLTMKKNDRILGVMREHTSTHHDDESD